MLRNSTTSWIVASTFFLLSLPLALSQPPAQSTDALVPPATNGINGTPGTMPSFKFDIVSFKPCNDPGWFSAKPVQPPDGDFISYRCQPVQALIYYAYDVPQHPFLLSGQPGWVDTDRYDFQAKVAPEDIDAWRKLDLASRRMMMRGMLVDSLKIKLHPDTTPHAVYVLVVAKSGIKFTPYKDGETNTLPDGRTLEGKGLVATDPDGTAYYQGESMPQFAEAISTRIGKQVINKTDLRGGFDFRTFMPAAHYDPRYDTADDSPIPHVIAGVKALGLELVSTKEITGGLIIDHIEHPPQN
jgi:bla regulator protein blaR1